MVPSCRAERLWPVEQRHLGACVPVTAQAGASVDSLCFRSRRGKGLAAASVSLSSRSADSGRGSTPDQEPSLPGLPPPFC